MDNPKINENDFFIHFIESHDERRNFKISLKSKDKTNELELLKEDKFNSLDSSYISRVYRFKEIINKNNYDNLIQLQEKKDNNEIIFEKKIEIKINKKYHYIFIFSILYKSKKGEYSHSLLNSTNIKPPLNFEEELQLYKKVIREKYNNEQTLYKELRNSVFQVFMGDKKFSFINYISGLLECYDSHGIYNYIMSFKFKKINELGEPTKEQLKVFKENINKFNDNPNIIINKVKTEDQKKALEQLNLIILYFNYNFQKEKIDSMFKSSEISNDLFHIIKTNQSKFPSFFLTKNTIKRNILASANLIDIKEILSYSKNCLELLENIEHNKVFILNKYNIEKKEKKINESLLIKIDKNAKMKEDDDLNKILNLLENIVKYEVENNALFLIVSEDFFKNIITFSIELNYSRLILAKNIINNYIKKIDKHFKIKDLDNAIHKTGLKFINIGKFKTKQILDFIQEDVYYIDKIFEKSSEREINILKNIKIEEIDEEFIKKWNNLDLSTIFKKQENNFYSIICSLVKNVKDFNILYKLLYEQKKCDKTKVLSSIQNEFLSRFTNCSLDDLNHNIDIISNLIYYSDKQKVNIKKFLEQIEKKLNKVFLRNLYIYILNNKKDINNNTKIKLTNFIESDNDYESIILTIKNLNKDNEKNFSKLKKYLFEEKDFLEMEETFNMILLKMLVSKNIIKEKQEQDNIFIKSTLKTLESLKDKMMLNDFTYNEISIFFEDENNEIFLKRVCLIYLIKEEDIPNLKKDPKSLLNETILPMVNTCKDRFNIQKKNIISLKLIYDDYLIFYPNNGKIKMKEINSLIDKIKSSNIGSISIEDEDKIKSFIKEDSKKAEDKIKLKQSFKNFK